MACQNLPCQFDSIHAALPTGRLVRRPQLRLPIDRHASAQPPGDDALRVSFDRIADRYDGTRAYADGVPVRIAEALEEELTTECAIIEIGVGTGRTAEPLRAHGFDVVGIDVSSRMLSIARGKGVSDLALADATALPFVDGAFDHALSVHVTHLIGDWRTALSEVVRVSTDRFVAITTEREGCDTEAMRRAYEGFCADAGHEVRHPGILESDLAGLVRPMRVRDVADSRSSVAFSDAMARYRERAFSDLWNVPEDVHQGAIRLLEERYAGVERLERRDRIVMIVWSVKDLGRFLADGSR
jgi:SAM-dependent methyltransferase